MGLGEQMQDIHVERMTEEQDRLREELRANSEALAALRLAMEAGEEEDRREREARADRGKGKG